MCQTVVAGPVFRPGWRGKRRREPGRRDNRRRGGTDHCPLCAFDTAVDSGRRGRPARRSARCRDRARRPGSPPPSQPGRRRRSRGRGSLRAASAGRCARSDAPAGGGCACRAHRHHAALPVGDAVDLGEAVEAHAHQAIGRATGAADGGLADAAKPASSTAAAAEAPSGTRTGAALDLDRHRGGPAVRPLRTSSGCLRNIEALGRERGQHRVEAPAATIGANALACAPARVTPLWQLAVKAPGYLSHSS